MGRYVQPGSSENSVSVCSWFPLAYIVCPGQPLAENNQLIEGQFSHLKSHFRRAQHRTNLVYLYSIDCPKSRRVWSSWPEVSGIFNYFIGVTQTLVSDGLETKQLDFSEWWLRKRLNGFNYVTPKQTKKPSPKSYDQQSSTSQKWKS